VRLRLRLRFGVTRHLLVETVAPLTALGALVGLSGRLGTRELVRVRIRVRVRVRVRVRFNSP